MTQQFGLKKCDVVICSIVHLLNDTATSYSTEQNYIWSLKPLQYAYKELYTHARVHTHRHTHTQSVTHNETGKQEKGWCKSLTNMFLISAEAGTFLCFSLVESQVQLASFY